MKTKWNFNSSRMHRIVDVYDSYSTSGRWVTVHRDGR